MLSPLPRSTDKQKFVTQTETRLAASSTTRTSAPAAPIAHSFTSRVPLNPHLLPLLVLTDEVGVVARQSADDDHAPVELALRLERHDLVCPIPS